MGEIFTKAGGLMLMIGLGFFLRKRALIKKEDVRTLMALIMNVTLPAVVISSFQGFEQDMSLILVSLLAIGMNAAMSLAGYLAAGRQGRREQAFGVINYSGYNVGAFAMPYLQNFVGREGIMVACLFDSGNAIMCSGMVYVIASGILKGGERQSAVQVVRKLIRVVPFDVYIIMMILYFADIHLPGAVYRIAGSIGSANTFLAMLVIGASVYMEKKEIRKELPEQVLKNLWIRYLLAGIFSVMIYTLLPFGRIVRQILVLIACAPVSSITVINTAKCGLDEERAGIVNSASILVSLILITVLASVWRLGA